MRKGRVPETYTTKKKNLIRLEKDGEEGGKVRG